MSHLGVDVFSETKRLIVVAAHPDDLETQLGGTVALLAQRGVEIFSVNCTLGDIGAQDDTVNRTELAGTRIREAEEAGEILGVKATYNLERHDGELVPDLALRAEIARLYRVTQADTLITFDPHWRGQIHPDHRAAGRAALDAYMPSKMPLYRPEQLTDPAADLGCLERVLLFNTDDPDVIIDVEPVYETKLAACLVHQSQFPKGLESLEWMKKLDQRRGEPAGYALGEAMRRMGVW